MVVVVACTGGDGAGQRPEPTSTTAVPTTPASTVTTSPTTTQPVDEAGSVTLRVSGFTLPDVRSGGTGMRLIVRASSTRLTVRRRGGGGAVTVCPVTTATAPAAAADCVDLGAPAAVEVRFVGGVELRATAVDAPVEEVGVTYVPVDRSTTLVTPARPAGACAARACQATFSLTPAGAGSFALDGRAGGGRPRLVLEARAVAGGSNRTLATVEGGGLLSIRGTLEAGMEATLLHHEQGPDAVAPMTAEISWP